LELGIWNFFGAWNLVLGTSAAAQRRRRLAAIAQLILAAFARAVRAAKHLAAGFHAVTDDLAPAVLALWRHHGNRAFEAIEHMCFAVLP
jgi:hypothetical protein